MSNASQGEHWTQCVSVGGCVCIELLVDLSGLLTLSLHENNGVCSRKSQANSFLQYDDMEIEYTLTSNYVHTNSCGTHKRMIICLVEITLVGTIFSYCSGEMVFPHWQSPHFKDFHWLTIDSLDVISSLES